MDVCRRISQLLSALTLRGVRQRYIALLMMSSIAINLLALALPLMTMQIYDRVLAGHATDTLKVLTVGVLLAAVMELAMRIGRSVLVGIAGARFEHAASVQAMTRVMETDHRNLHADTPAQTAQDILSAARLKEHYAGQMSVTMLVDLPFILVFFGLQIFLAAWLALVPLAVLVLFTALSWQQGRQLKRAIEKREIEDDKRYGFITGTLHVIHSVKAMCLESILARRFEEVQRESGSLNYRIAVLNGQVGSLSYSFAQLMTVAVICAGAPLAIQGHITVGVLIACVLLSGQIMQPLQRGLVMWIRFQDVALAKQRLTSILNLPAREIMPHHALQPNHGGIKLENVRFSYAAGRPVLDGCQANINPGEMVVIQGPPGAGKTTLLEVMAGLYVPDRGRALVSGMDASAIPSGNRTHYIAHLPTQGLMLRGSILENITGFDLRHQPEAHIIADWLGIDDSVSLLPAGYDTPVEGVGTDVISPGLKQRICIARALMHKPRVILFDNADHGLDRESYGKVFALLARLKGKATIVAVSDDRNILSLADHVFELRRGQLVAVMEPLPIIAETSLVRGALHL